VADQQQQTRNRFGTFGGVFTPSLLTILGAIMFMRSGFVTGEAGIIGAIVILLLAKVITTFTALSISAVSTNMQVRGGGAYFLISRVLGPESGGAIGIVLFIAQALSVPFYILGFTEALTSSVPALAPYFMLITLLSAGLLFGVAYIGAGWSIRVQYIVMAVLGLSIIAFMAGSAVLFDPAVFTQNLAAGYTVMPTAVEGGGIKFSFWTIFAIYFPAVTGILAGVNMSGDLENPGKSIPRGTLLAIGVGLAVYLAQILICGGAFPREELIARPFEVLRDNAIWETGFIVVAGVVAATLSSALGSYLGAPRILQAVARDRLLGVLQPFARGSAQGDEPRPALILTGIITLIVLVWAGQMPGGGGFNAVAALITMFFLYTYGMLNLAAFIEATGNNPSFRPRFRAFNWLTALLGALACAGVAVLIDPLPAVIAFLVIIALYWHLKRRQLNTTFGDARRGFIYTAVRNNLLKLRGMAEDPKNWRPTVLVFSGNPATRETLVAYAVWLESGRGIVQMVNIVKAPPHEACNHHRRALMQLESFCRKNDIHAFPIVAVDEDIDRAILSIMQTASVGPIRPNLALFGWTAGADGVLLTHLRRANALGMSQVVVRGQGLPKPGGKKRIDVYWRGRDNGSLMLLLAHLLSRNWEWADSKIRLIRVVEREEGRIPARTALIEMVEAARLEAEILVPVSTDPFIDTLRETSADATCIFLGFILPEELSHDKAIQGNWVRMLEGMPTTILVNNAGTSELLE